MKNELENFIDNNREAFDSKMPNPAVLERIQQQMQESGKKKEKGILISMRTVRWAAAACLILLAGGIYRLTMQGNIKENAVSAETVQSAKPAPAAPVQQPAALPEPPKENTTAPVHFAAAAEDLKNRKQVLFAKLNNMESPSQRMTAAAQINEFKTVGNDIVDALVNTLDNDPSTNVRLAALEGLSRFYKESYVKKKLIASLKKQNDPMVQIGLIELLTKMRESSILTELDKMVNDGNTMEAVKDHAYSSILKLRTS